MMETELNSVVEVAIQISAKRMRVLVRLREALKRGDDKDALALARQLCGLYDEPIKPS